MDYRRKFSGYASRPDAQWMLFGVAMLEAICVPIPSDFLMIPMSLLAPERALRFAVMAGLGSAAGALVSYAFGWGLYQFVISHFITGAWLANALMAFKMYSGVFVFSAGFSAVPFNIVTILSGMAQINLLWFVGLTLLVRFLRYALIGWLIWRGGARYQEWLERNYYGTMLVITLALLVVSAIGVLLFETS